MISFRYDINGLRAIAVLAVVLFHFQITLFSGGFVGVDVFFVISGYLMTGIIVEGLQSQRFSIFTFYLARAKRIIPALLVLCLTILILGYFLLLPNEYEQFITHAFASISFLSNIVYWRESGYFDSSSHEKLLLHSWSLSVEWQFYLILPLVMACVWQLWKKQSALWVLLIITFIGSLIFCIYWTQTDQSAAFYLLPFRAWEMLIGGLIFMGLPYLNQRLLSRPKVRNALFYSGLILIIASIIWLNDQYAWPGYLAIIPVAGSCFILMANKQNSWLLNNPVIQYIGTISYSLYLWHWPIMAYISLNVINRNTFDISTNNALALGFILSFILAITSYELIEKKTKQFFRLKSRKKTTLYIIGLVLFTTMACLGMKALQKRNADHVLIQLLAIPPSEKTVRGNKLGVIVVGDSHANALFTAVENALPSPDYYGENWSGSGCRNIQGIKQQQQNYKHCDQLIRLNETRVNEAIEDVPVVIIERLSNTLSKSKTKPDEYITTQYDEYTDDYFEEMQRGYVNLICAYRKKHPVYLLRPLPEMPHSVPSAMANHYEQTKKIVREKISLTEYHARHARSIKAQNQARDDCGAKIIEVLPTFCDHQYCYGDKDGKPLYSDTNHLNQIGANLLITNFKEMY